MSKSIPGIILLLNVGLIWLLVASCTSTDEKKKEVVATSYEKVMADYQENGLAAQEKYKDKLVTFPAQFYSATQGIGGINVIVFEGRKAIVSIFDHDSEPILKKLKQGDAFNMTCAVQSGVMLDDCTAK